MKGGRLGDKGREKEQRSERGIKTKVTRDVT
jgi:hypothetical protein